MIPHLLSLILVPSRLRNAGPSGNSEGPSESAARLGESGWSRRSSHLCCCSGYNLNASGFQFVERAQWIPSIGAQYLIGIDGISLLMSF